MMLKKEKHKGKDIPPPSLFPIHGLPGEVFVLIETKQRNS